MSLIRILALFFSILSLLIAGNSHAESTDTQSNENKESPLELQNYVNAMRERKLAGRYAGPPKQEVDAYVALVEKKLKVIALTNPPKDNEGNGLYGNAIVKIAIKQDGNLISASITQSSGDPIFDNKLIKIVQKASPFDPFPSSWVQVNSYSFNETWGIKKTGGSPDLIAPQTSLDN